MRSTSFRSVVEPRFQDGGAVSRMDQARKRLLASYMGREPGSLPGNIDLTTSGLTAALQSIRGQMSSEDIGGMEELRRAVEQKYVPPPLSKYVMQVLAREGGKELVEERMNERARETGGEGGRVVEYSGGAMEWVPDGPGGIPQPTTGDTFYDPIADAQARVAREEFRRLNPRPPLTDERRAAIRASIRQAFGRTPVSDEDRAKLARGGIVRSEVERSYQAGGLAAATGGGEEEETSTPAITVDQIVARTTSSDVTPSLTSMIIQNKEQALARLRAGREEISTRRAERAKSQERDKWLALAQGMLAPTRTGGFGESLGQTAGLLREESARRAQSEAESDEQLDSLAAQEIAVEAQAIDQMLKQAGYENEARGIHGSIKTIVNPDHVDLPVADQQLILATQILQEDGTWQLTPARDKDGEYFEAADTMSPARAAALIRATVIAEEQAGRGQAMIDEAYAYKDPLRNIRRANDILENAETIIETSGVQQLKNRIANWLGIDFGDTVELTELQMIIAEDYLKKLTELKGNTSDRDVREMKGISVGLGQNTTANYRQLRMMEQIYSTAIRRGLREAYQTGEMDVLADLWEAADDHLWEPSAVFITGQEDFDKLDAGTYYYLIGDWGGSLRQKSTEEEIAAAQAEAAAAAEAAGESEGEE